MEDQRPWLFLPEDGVPLSFAVHEDVPQRDRVIFLIEANKGNVTKDVATADFVIIFSSLPGIEQMVHMLHGEGKLVIQDWWIRNSVQVGRVLPWYDYEVVERVNSTITEEERDWHELISAAARYWPLLTAEVLYQFVARQCPHLSLSQIRKLHMSDRQSFDSSVSYARLRLDSGLTPGGALAMKPKIAFGSPSKLKDGLISVQPSYPPEKIPQSNVEQEDRDIRRPQRPSTIDTTIRIPISMTLATANRSESNGLPYRSDGPEPGPNLDRTPSGENAERIARPAITPPSVPPPRPIEVRTDSFITLTSSNFENTALPPLSPLSSLGTILPEHTEPSSSITDQQRQVSIERASESPNQSAVPQQKRVSREVASLVKLQFEEERSGKLSRLRHTRDVHESFTPLPRVSAKKRPKLAINLATPADFEALAIYHLDNPRKVGQQPYYKQFAAQHRDKGTSRSAVGWIGVVNRHEQKIKENMERIFEERKTAGLVSPDAKMPPFDYMRDSVNYDPSVSLFDIFTL